MVDRNLGFEEKEDSLVLEFLVEAMQEWISSLDEEGFQGAQHAGERFLFLNKHRRP